ncbi:jg2414, partial [Pararge aegeria aegeria]
MALKSGVSFIRLKRLFHGIRLLSTHTRPEISQNGSKTAAFPGATAPYVTEMKILNEHSYDPIPIYRVLDNSGEVIDKT